MIVKTVRQYLFSIPGDWRQFNKNVPRGLGRVGRLLGDWPDFNCQQPGGGEGGRERAIDWLIATLRELSLLVNQTAGERVQSIQNIYKFTKIL